MGVKGNWVLKSNESFCFHCDEDLGSCRTVRTEPLVFRKQLKGGTFTWMHSRLYWTLMFVCPQMNKSFHL